MNKNLKFSLKVGMVFITMCFGSEAWAVNAGSADPTGAGCYRVDRETGGYMSDNDRYDYSASQTNDEASAKIRVGNVHLMDTDIQPIGSVLAYASVPPTEYKVYNATPNTLLWACRDTTDFSKIRFISSVNGDDRVGGRWLVSDPYVTKVNPPNDNANGETNVFYTAFNGVGIRQKMDGVVLTRQWTILPTPPTYVTGSGALVATGSDNVRNAANRNKCRENFRCIRLGDLPNLQFELIRVVGIPPNSVSGGEPAQNNWCGVPLNLIQSGNYSCRQPASYISLGHTGGHPDGDGDKGDSLVRTGHNLDTHTHGYDSWTWEFWGDDNGFGYTLWNAAFLINDTTPTCRVQTPVTNIPFGKVSLNSLNSGQSYSKNFDILVDCKNGVNSAVSGSNAVAIGIQVSQGAYNAAKTHLPSLLHDSPTSTNGQPANAVKALLSDNYGTTGVADNVGVYFKYQAVSGYNHLIGQPGATGTLLTTPAGGYADYCGPNKELPDGSAPNNPRGGPYGSTSNPQYYCYPGVTYPQGNDAGWFPVLYNAIGAGTPKAGFTRWRIPYTAVLKKIDGTPANSVTVGTIQSTAYVVVKVQ